MAATDTQKANFIADGKGLAKRFADLKAEMEKYAEAHAALGSTHLDAYYTAHADTFPPKADLLDWIAAVSTITTAIDEGGSLPVGLPTVIQKCVE